MENEANKYCNDLACAVKVKILPDSELEALVKEYGEKYGMWSLLEEEENCYDQIKLAPHVSPPLGYAKKFFKLCKKYSE